MQETTYEDGRRIREFFKNIPPETLEDSMRRQYEAAIADEKVKEVRQVKIGRNDPCPCGSGRKFKRCCIKRVNKGPQPVQG